MFSLVAKQGILLKLVITVQHFKVVNDSIALNLLFESEKFRFITTFNKRLGFSPVVFLCTLFFLRYICN